MAVAARFALAPCAPTRAEREAHEATRLPFRSWCAECVKGRADNPPHRSVPGVEEEGRRLPEFHFDYAFLRREVSDKLLTLAVMKARPTRAVRAWAVPRKGVTDADTVERLYKGVCETGVRPPCVFKCDNEPSIKAVREELVAGPGAVPQEPPVGESQSNGAVEHAVKLLKGMIRVHAIALERKLGVTIPLGHAAPTWIVEAVSDMITKHLRGQDGRTAFGGSTANLHGKRLLQLVRL